MHKLINPHKFAANIAIICNMGNNVIRFSAVFQRETRVFQTFSCP